MKIQEHKRYQKESQLELTGHADEWEKVSEHVWKNRLCHTVYKNDKGRVFDQHGKLYGGKSGLLYTGVESSVDITFPYKPKTEYLEMKERRPCFDLHNKSN